MTQKIKIVDYNPQWPRLFREETHRIHTSLPAHFVDIHHIGSTSVPGLSAKPIIDILLIIHQREGIISPLEEIGYQSRGEINIPFCQYFTKKNGGIPFHLHVYEQDNPEIEINLLFRDFLRSSPEACMAYAHLKHHLISQESSHHKSGHRLKGYTLGKNSFIQKILNQTGFKGFSLKFCTHFSEWDAYHRLTPFSEKRGDFTNSIPPHFHFVFYRGTQIIGVAHIEFVREDTALLHQLTLDECHTKDSDIRTNFLSLLTRWVGTRKAKEFKTDILNK